MGTRVSEAMVIQLVMEKLETLSGVDGTITNLGAEHFKDSDAPSVALMGDVVFEREPDGGASLSDQDDRVDVTWSVLCVVTPDGTRDNGMLAIAQIAENVANAFDNLTLSGSNHLVECVRPRVTVSYGLDEENHMLCSARVDCTARATRTSGSAKVIDRIPAA